MSDTAMCEVTGCPDPAGANGVFCDTHYEQCPNGWKAKLYRAIPADRERVIRRAEAAIVDQ